MKRIRMFSFAATLVASGVACADPVTLYSKETIPQNFYVTSEVWTNAAGETVSWENSKNAGGIRVKYREIRLFRLLFSLVVS